MIKELIYNIVFGGFVAYGIYAIYLIAKDFKEDIKQKNK